MSKALIYEAIQRIAVGPERGRDISKEDAQQIMQAILDGQIDPVQTAVFLIALRMKRESMDEFLGLFNGLQAGVEQQTLKVKSLLCIADPFDGYVRHLPMSPFLPAVLSACGYATLMHGVETVGPKHGVTAHKVYQLAGLPVNHHPKQVAGTLDEKGWGYVDQKQYLPSLHSLLPLRDKIVKRTAITTLERLLMPIRAKEQTHMVLGYVHKAYPEIYSAVAKQAGYDTILLVKGLEGGLTPALNKPLRRFWVDCQHSQFEEVEKELHTEHLPEQAGAAGVITQALSAAAVEACLEHGLAVLKGAAGVARESLVVAAATILEAHNDSLSFQEATSKAKNVLDNGKAYENFLNLR